jgi:hypothetical protein
MDAMLGRKQRLMLLPRLLIFWHSTFWAVTHIAIPSSLYYQIHAMTCAEENRAYAELFAKKYPLELMLDARKALEACMTKHYNATKEKCGDEFQATVDCLSKNSREWSKCAATKAALEECAAKNVL